MSGDASAKPGNGNKHNWHHSGIFIAGDDYAPDCFMVKKYTRSGRPYLVEVCG
jgi:hypothetical protein